MRSKAGKGIQDENSLTKQARLESAEFNKVSTFPLFKCVARITVNKTASPKLVEYLTRFEMKPEVRLK